MTTTLLDVQDLTVEFMTRRGIVKAVQHVNVTVAKGETVGIVGESGSGKSSLARLIVGLLPRKSGSVKFRGNELSVALKDRSKDDLRQIQFIYQLPDVALNPRQTIGEIIGRGFGPDEITDAVETVVETYLKHRSNAGEKFLDAYRRLGPAPFKEALYGGVEKAA